MTDAPFPGSRLHIARYHTPAVHEYRGNPFIEALPPIMERDEARDLMRLTPEYRAEDRNLPPSVREHLASLVAAIRQPTWLHGELYGRLSRLMCNGYLSRNPASRDFQPLLDLRQSLVESAEEPATGSTLDGGLGPRFNGHYRIDASIDTKSNGLAFLGTSGIGKTVGVEMVLNLWPQVILHKRYAGKPLSTVQIPWLKIDVPDDGNLIELAEKFFIALDHAHAKAGLATNYADTYIKERLKEREVKPKVTRVAAQVGLGLLVIDELQDLTPTRSKKLLSFLVKLVNDVGVPVVLIGGLDAFGIASEQFRQIRRSSTEGDLIVSHSEPGALWQDFCRVIWRYQYTTEWVDMTPEHADALFEVSQGITEVMVIAFKNAQIRAISTGRPFVTPKIIRQIRDTLNLAGPSLAALRRKSAFVIDKLSDLSVPPGVDTLPFLRGDAPTAKRAGAEGGQTAAEPPAAARPEPAEASQEGMRRNPRPDAPAPARHDRTEDGATLLDIVMRGRDAGRSPRESLALAGLGGGDLWHTVIGLPAEPPG